MGDEPDVDPEICRSFFEGNVLKLDPSLLTENGIRFVIKKSFSRVHIAPFCTILLAHGTV